MPLADHLSALDDRGLIHIAAAQPEMEYLFRHALIHDAAYFSLVKGDRQQIHLSVAAALEQLHAGRLESRDVAPVLARHYFEAGRPELALSYFTAAGDAAAAVYANSEALAHYTQGLALARQLQVVDDRLRHLFAGRGSALELSNQAPAALENYREMERLAEAAGDRALELEALMLQATLRATPTAVHDTAEGERLLERALALADGLGNRTARSKILWAFMNLFLYGGDNQRAPGYGEEALAIARELNLRDQIAFTLNDLYYAYLATRQVTRARAVQAEAQALWRELNIKPMLVDNLSQTALTDYFAGNFAHGLALSAEAEALSRVIDNAWGRANSQFMRGSIYFELGDLDNALLTMSAVIATAEEIHFLMPQIASRAELALALGYLGQVERGIMEARRAWAVGESGDFRALVGGWALGALVRLLVQMGDLPQADAVLREAQTVNSPRSVLLAPVYVPLAEAELALARGAPQHAVAVLDALLADLHVTEIRPAQAEALCLKGRALQAAGRTDAAVEVLAQARKLAEEITSRRTLWQILAALGEIEIVRGHAEAAAGLRAQARSVLGFIIDHISDDSLRASFLARPDVRALTV